jgi:thiamine-phosphate pyrophosphorylase
LPVRAAPGRGLDAPTPNPALTLPIVCLITDRTLVAEGRLVDAVVRAAAGGVTMVQLREKDLPTRELLTLAVDLRSALPPSTMLLINGRADIAFAAHAQGVHLPADGLPTGGARQVLGPSAVIGRSAHSAAEARAADNVDYVELGTIFPSRSHPGGAVVGTSEIRATRPFAVPVIAVGGITSDNTAAVMQAGASGIAVISAILADRDPRDATRRLNEHVRRGWEQRLQSEGAE